MILKKIKKIVILFLLVAMVGCNNSVDGSDKFKEVISSMHMLDNYKTTTVTYNSYTVERAGTTEKFDSTVEEILNVDGSKAFGIINTSSSLGDETKEEFYYENGVFYYDSSYGKYKVKGLDKELGILTIDAEKLYEKVEKVTLNSMKDYDLLNIIYSKVAQDEMYNLFSMEFGLSVEDVKYKPYKHTLKVDEDNKIIEQETGIEYTYQGEETKIKVISTSKTTFNQYGGIQVSMPSDLENYVDISKKEDELSLKEKLIQFLNYQKEGNRFTLFYNENETYIFDFDSSVFTYMVGIERYSYNWKTDIGTCNKCSLNFKKDEKLGICTENDIENINATKGYLEVELLQLNESMESLLKIGE